MNCSTSTSAVPRNARFQGRLAWQLLLLLFIGAMACELIADDSPGVQLEEVVLKALRPIASNVQTDRETGLVRFVRLSKPVVENAHLELVGQFSAIRYLAVVTPHVTDEGFQHLAGLSSLEVLFLSGSGLTDETLAVIGKLPKLRRLYLDRTTVTDAGLKHLSELPLKTLSLNETKVTSAAASSIGALASLEELSLQGTRLDDKALSSLASLEQLQLLELDRTAVTGSTLRQLKSLKQLRQLSLRECKLSADGVAALAELSPASVVLWNTQMPVDALATLRAAQPNVHYAVSDKPNAWRRFLAGEPLASPLAPTAEAEAGASRAPAGIASTIELSIARRLEDSAAAVSPDFQRHVLPMLGRLGCNGRSCHGSFQGRGGFRLSMFGYD
ncbi:MAG: hypothetical protein KDB14_16805, partial [Planctomycetales bacterium]|nr:hypothetical protein [Planctomycetales bacterium]